MIWWIDLIYGVGLAVLLMVLWHAQDRISELDRQVRDLQRASHWHRADASSYWTPSRERPYHLSGTGPTIVVRQYIQEEL